MSFNIDNPIKHSGLLGAVLNDNADAAANILYSSLKNAEVATPATTPATPTSLGTIQMAGVLTGTATSPELANGSVGPLQLAPNAVTSASIAPGSITGASIAPGSITFTELGELGSGLVGTTQIVNGAVGSTQIADGAIGTLQLAPLSGPSKLIGSNNASSLATNIAIGNGLTMSDEGILNSVLDIPISVSDGGTGVTTLPSGDIILGNGTGPVMSVSAIPATAVTPNLVGSVNGVVPSSAGGNVSVLISSVTTGTLAVQPVQPQPSGDIYVVSGDPLSSNNGLTFISTGTTWQPVTNDLATTDARYIQLSGSTMYSNAELVFPSTGHITLKQTTFAPTDAVTAEYVASQIISAPLPPPSPTLLEATTTSVGMIKLAGALSGTATEPTIASGVITQTNIADNSIGSSQIISGSVGATQLGANVVGTEQLAPLSDTSTLLGSDSSSSEVTNITLGPGLSMTGSVLSTNAVPGATFSTLGTIQLSGALTGTAVTPALASGSVGTTQIVSGSVGATQLGANVVGVGQLAPMSSTSQLVGSNSTSPSAANITLGSGLVMSTAGVLSVNSPSATSTSLGTIQLAGALTGTATSPVLASNSVGSSQIAAVAVGSGQIANGAVGPTQLAANSVGLTQLAPLSSPSELIGSTSSSNTATNIVLGAGLAMSATGVLSASSATPSATATSLGTIQLSGALSGTATSPAISNNAVGTAQLANNAVTSAQLANGSVGTMQLAALSAPSELLGSASGSSSAVNITLGSGLTMSAGGQLSVSGVPIPEATSSSLGGIEMSGDLTGSLATEPTIAPSAISLTKLANLSATSELIGSGSTSTVPTYITLGPSLSMTASQLNGSTSFFQGTNPNITAPSDRSQTVGVLYFGTDGSTWVWNGSSYSSNTGSTTGIISSAPTFFSPDGNLQLSMNISGQILASYLTGTKIIYVHGSETSGTSQSGGIFGQGQSIGSTATVIGGAGQRVKTSIALGSMINYYNITDGLFYNINYFVTSVGSPNTGFVQVRTM